MAANKTKGIPLKTLVFTFFLVLLAVRLFSSFFPYQRLWGFNHAAYLDWMFFLYPVLMVIGFLLYWKSDSSLLSSEFDLDNAKHKRIHPVIPFIIAVICIAGYYFLSTDTHFLGDGYPLLSWLSKPNIGLKARAFGDMKAHRALIQLLGGINDENVRQSFRLLSVFSGAVFVSALLYYGRKLTDSLFSYITLVVLNLLGAGTLLFFGYVELYSLETASIYVMILSAIASIRNKQKSIVPILAFLAAVFFHLLGLVYLPSLIAYLVLAFLPVGRIEQTVKRIKLITLTSIVIFMVMYLLVRFAAPIYWQQALLPPLGDRFTTDNYFLLSFSHILDYINLLFLIIPVTLLTVLAGFFVSEKEKVQSQPSIIVLFSITTVFSLLAAFAIEPQLGMARDWDLVSTMLIGAQVIGIYLWVDRFGKAKSFRLASVLVGLTCLSVFVPWLAIHISHDGQYSYIRSRVMQDIKHCRTELEYLITYNNRRGNKSEADSLSVFFEKHFPEKAMFMEGTGYLNRGYYKQAELIYRQVILENPAIFMPYLKLGQIYFNKGDYKKSLEYLKIADGLNPYNTDVNFHLGVSYLALGRKNKAFNCWRNSIYYDSDSPLAYMGLGRYYYEHGQYDSALYYFSMPPVKEYPGDYQYYIGMSRLKMGDTAQAIDCFKKYLSNGITDSAYYIKVMKQKQALGF